MITSPRNGEVLRWSLCSLYGIVLCWALVRTGLAQHGLGTFVRLVRAVLGSSAVADAKTEFGPELVILGIQVQVPPCGDLAACALLLCVRAGDVRL